MERQLRENAMKLKALPITNTRTIEAVWLAGQPVDRPALAKGTVRATD
jgi:hypothetical protein